MAQGRLAERNGDHGPVCHTVGKAGQTRGPVRPLPLRQLPQPPLEVVEAALDLAQLGEELKRVLPAEGIPGAGMSTAMLRRSCSTSNRRFTPSGLVEQVFDSKCVVSGVAGCCRVPSTRTAHSLAGSYGWQERPVLALASLPLQATDVQTTQHLHTGSRGFGVKPRDEPRGGGGSRPRDRRPGAGQRSGVSATPTG